MEIVRSEIRVDTGVDYSFCQLTNERKEGDGAKVFEKFIAEL